MIYYGPPNDSSDHKRSSLQLNADEILVLQQHCGGENLPVYKGFVRPNGTENIFIVHSLVDVH